MKIIMATSFPPSHNQGDIAVWPAQAMSGLTHQDNVRIFKQSDKYCYIAKKFVNLHFITVPTMGVSGAIVQPA